MLIASAVGMPDPWATVSSGTFIGAKHPGQTKADLAFEVATKWILPHRGQRKRMTAVFIKRSFSDRSQECSNPYLSMTRQRAKNEPKSEVSPEPCPQVVFERSSPQLLACKPRT